MNTIELWTEHSLGNAEHEGDNRKDGCPTCFDPIEGYPWNLSLASYRGWDENAHFNAILSDNIDSIALTHPTNWLTEEEVEFPYGREIISTS